jgi:hypothetical protein
VNPEIEEVLRIAAAVTIGDTLRAHTKTFYKASTCVFAASMLLASGH